MSGREGQHYQAGHGDDKSAARPGATMVVWPDGGLGFLLVALMVTGSSAYASNASQDTIAVFQAVVEAVKAVEHPLTGKGSALVQINRPASVLQRPPTGEDAAARQIDLHSRHLSSAKTDFVFKGLLSRSTRRNMAEDGRAQPLVTWVVGDRCAITYNSSGTGWAIVRREPELPFYRQIGYDFNPRTFMRHETTPLAELLERVLKGPATLSTRMDADGILHLIGEYRSPKQHEHTVISVDPAKGYRLTTYLCSMESFDQPGRSFTEFIEIQWADYGPACYVKTVNRSVYAGIHSWEDKPSISTSDLLKSIDVSVSEFQPNIEIDDAEFTLQGLRLPQGTEVIDEISGVTYRIDGGDLQTDVLEKPLAQAHFVHKIGNQRPGQDANADGQASSMERTEESAAKTAAARKVGLIIPVALIVLGGVILVLISRHRASFVRKVR